MSNTRSNVNMLSRHKIEEGQKYKFVYVKINNNKVKLQLDTGSDILIINEETWKKVGKFLLKKTDMVAHGVSGKKLNFKGIFTCNISFVGKTLKSKVIVQQNILNLFRMDWIALFDLWKLPINPFCNKIDVASLSTNRVAEN